MEPLIVLAIVNVVSVFAVPLTVYVLLRHGVVGGEPRDVSLRKLGMQEQGLQMAREKHEFEMEERRARTRDPREVARAAAAAVRNGNFGPRNMEG